MVRNGVIKFSFTLSSCNEGERSARRNVLHWCTVGTARAAVN